MERRSLYGSQSNPGGWELNMHLILAVIVE